jgi:hypothetical protein
MPATAVAITPEGWLTDVDLGDPDLRLAHLRTLVGCAAVQPILLADDLVVWVANTVDASSLNIAATDLIMITATVPNQTIYGTVVCTGHAVDGVDVTPIPEKWAQYLANHQAVQPVDDAVHQPSAVGE